MKLESLSDFSGERSIGCLVVRDWSEQGFGSRDHVQFKSGRFFIPVTCPGKRQNLKAKGRQIGLLSPIPNNFVNPYSFDPCTKKITPGNQ